MKSDLQFFKEHGFEYKHESRSVEKYFFDSALTVNVYHLFECFEIEYSRPVKHGGAMFKGKIVVPVISKEAAIKHIEEFAKRMEE